MAAERVVETACAIAGLARDAAARRAPPQERQHFAQARLRRARRAGTRGAVRAATACSTKRRTSPVQGASSTVPGRRNMSQGARAAPRPFSRRASGPSDAMKLQPATSATVAVSSLRAAIGHQHFADQAGRRAGNERRQGRHQRALGIRGCDDDAQHSSAASWRAR